MCTGKSVCLGIITVTVLLVLSCTAAATSLLLTTTAAAGAAGAAGAAAAGAAAGAGAAAAAMLTTITLLLLFVLLLLLLLLLLLPLLLLLLPPPPTFTAVHNTVREQDDYSVACRVSVWKGLLHVALTAIVTDLPTYWLIGIELVGNCLGPKKAPVQISRVNRNGVSLSSAKQTAPLKKQEPVRTSRDTSASCTRDYHQYSSAAASTRT